MCTYIYDLKIYHNNNSACRFTWQSSISNLNILSVGNCLIGLHNNFITVQSNSVITFWTFQGQSVRNIIYQKQYHIGKFKGFLTSNAFKFFIIDIIAE